MEEPVCFAEVVAQLRRIERHLSDGSNTGAIEDPRSAMDALAVAQAALTELDKLAQRHVDSARQDTCATTAGAA